MTTPLFKLRFIASDDQSRKQGLMFAKPLDEDEAVLFTFPYSDRFAFWNKNVNFGLSLAFLDDIGRVVDIVDMEPNSENSVSPKFAAKHVIEASKGAFIRKGINCGDILQYTNNNIVSNKFN